MAVSRKDSSASRNTRETSAATEKEPLPHVAGMVERVAVAMCNDLGVHPYDSHEEDGVEVFAWEREASTARAAIEAMREPTDGMLKAGAKADWVGEVESREGCSIMPSQVFDWNEEDEYVQIERPGIWTSMINAALADAPVEASPRQVGDDGPGIDQ